MNATVDRSRNGTDRAFISGVVCRSVRARLAVPEWRRGSSRFHDAQSGEEAADDLASRIKHHAASGPARPTPGLWPSPLPARASAKGTVSLIQLSRRPTSAATRRRGSSMSSADRPGRSPCRAGNCRQVQARQRPADLVVGLVGSGHPGRQQRKTHPAAVSAANVRAMALAPPD